MFNGSVAMFFGIDRVLSWLKWPFGILCLVFLPGVAYAFSFVARELVQHPPVIAPMLVGAGIFVVIWLAVLRPRTSLHYLVTLEHELTHALLAVLTFHRVPGLVSTLRGGGHIRYTGRGNWLISIAPFVVPTVSLIVLAASVGLRERHILGAVLGFTLAWNVIANWSSTHRHHGDHREAGSLFSFLFITCSNLLVLGIMLAYITQAHSITGHLDHVRGPTSAFFSWLVKVFTPG